MSLVGVLHLSSKYRYGLTGRGVSMYLFTPYDEAQPEMIVGCSERDTTRNQIAVVELLYGGDSKQKPRGSLQRLLGPVGDRSAEISGLLEHYCPAKQRQLRALNPVSEDLKSPADDERLEISAETGWITFHIDPPGCRDIDDALAFHPATGRWATTIADVAAIVPDDSELDMRAAAIGATFYDAEGRVVVPMLPPTLSEGSASLLPGKRRRGLTLLDGQFVPTWITVNHSFTYDTFPTSALAGELGLQGCDAHVLVEEAMLEYNRAAAGALKAAGVGFLRVQKEADAAAIAEWPPALRFLGMEAATYESVSPSTAQEHAGLGGLYCHASSPLRRYVDLVNQRLLKEQPASVGGLGAEHLNARATANRRWSRDVWFLNCVLPGSVQMVTATWLGGGRVWIPEWRRILRLRHEEERAVGESAIIKVFCDPTRRNWKQRVLTGSAV